MPHRAQKRPGACHSPPPSWQPGKRTPLRRSNGLNVEELRGRQGVCQPDRIWQGGNHPGTELRSRAADRQEEGLDLLRCRSVPARGESTIPLPCVRLAYHGSAL